MVDRYIGRQGVGKGGREGDREGSSKRRRIGGNVINVPNGLV